MSRFVIRPDQLPGALKTSGEASRVAVQLAAFRAAVRTQTLLKRRSRKLANDRGVYANAWQVQPRSVRTYRKAKLFGRREICRVENLTPYAGVIELGARPHPVSLEAQKSIREWVRRNLRVASWSKAGRSGGQVQTGTRMRKKKDPELDRITKAIVWKIQRYGQKPRYVVSGVIDQIQRFTQQMVAREIKRMSHNPKRYR